MQHQVLQTCCSLSVLPLAPRLRIRITGTVLTLHALHGVACTMYFGYETPSDKPVLPRRVRLRNLVCTGNLENHTLVGVVMTLLEVFRRYQWTFIRVETELRKISAKADRSHHLSTSSSAISLTSDRSGHAHAHAHVHVLMTGEGPGGLDEGVGVGVGDEAKVVVGGGALAHTHAGHVAHGYAPTN